MSPGLPTFGRKLLAAALDVRGRRLSLGYDCGKTIVVAGSPRGGTSWVAEAIARSPGYLLLWEPLELASHPGAKALGIPYNPYVAPHSRVRPDMPEWCVYQYLECVLSGKVRLSEYLRMVGWRSAPLRNLLFFRKYIVKFVRGNLLLHWMLTEFQLKGVLILRHPCAVVASQIHMAWERPSQWRDGWLPFLDRYDSSLARLARSLTTREEVLALDWAITNLVPLRAPRPHPWFLTSYEDLLQHPEEWKSMCSYLGCPEPPRQVLSRPSSTAARQETGGGPAFSVSKWKRCLSGSQVEAILRVCSEAGLDIYDRSPCPVNVARYRGLGRAEDGTRHPRALAQ